MPVTITFDVVRPEPLELNRIRGFFERLGWEHLGKTAYRYPKLDSREPTEDWFNHVVPALMLLRAFAVHLLDTGRSLDTFTIDVQSLTGHDLFTGVGTPPLPADQVPVVQPSRAGRAFRLRNLMAWLDGSAWPY
jgi:hypothetical protein